MKDIKDYIRTETLIRCETELEASAFLELLKRNNYTYTNGADYKALFNIEKEFYCLYYEDLCSATEILNREVINASEFLQEEIKGELTKEEAKVLTEEYEYGEKIGSIAWGIEVAKKESEVYHIKYGRCFLIKGTFCFGKRTPYNNLIVEFDTLNGYYRKTKIAKEELIEEIIEGALLVESINSKKQRFKEILGKYKIEKNE